MKTNNNPLDSSEKAKRSAFLSLGVITKSIGLDAIHQKNLNELQEAINKSKGSIDPYLYQSLSSLFAVPKVKPRFTMNDLLRHSILAASYIQ